MIVCVTCGWPLWYLRFVCRMSLEPPLPSVTRLSECQRHMMLRVMQEIHSVLQNVRFARCVRESTEYLKMEIKQAENNSRRRSGWAWREKGCSEKNTWEQHQHLCRQAEQGEVHFISHCISQEPGALPHCHLPTGRGPSLIRHVIVFMLFLCC